MDSEAHEIRNRVNEWHLLCDDTHQSRQDSFLCRWRSNKNAIALGTTPSQLDGATLVRIDIENPQTAGLRTSSGNEAGANSQWIPSGRLPNGSLEAVIDARRIPAGSITATRIGE